MAKARIERFAGPAAFLAEAEDYLCQAEVENNLILGIARELAERPAAPGEDHYFATVWRGGSIQGCAFRTMAGKVGVTRVPEREVLAVIARDVLEACPDAASVLGPEPTAGEMAALLAAATGRRPVPWMSQRIHELQRVTVLTGLPGGRLRVAEGSESAVLAPWVGAMLRMISDPRDPVEVTRERIDSGQLLVWDDGGPVSMAAWTGKTRHGVRINLVYTPPELRGRGYATACVAALSQRLLDQGNRSCCLYTDLANPTSNAIYARIGYRPVCDAALYSLAPPLTSE